MDLRRAILLALACAALAGGLRLADAGSVFVDGTPRLVPIDDLYHLKRMAFSASHFPAVLERDPDRGVGAGAFAPWPPLYDVSAAAFARLFGSHSVGDVLGIVIWLPPLLSTIFVGLFVLVVAPRAPVAAAVAGAALACSPFLVTISSVADIDHHYLEGPLTFAIVGTVALILSRERNDARRAVLDGVLLGVAMAAGLFVQTALLLSCGLAFLVLYFLARPLPAGVAFSLLSVVVIVYRATRPPGYPDSGWFIGWPHAALFAAAATASFLALATESGSDARVWRVVALVIGSGVALVPRESAAALLQGTGFVAGDRWLRTIDEFQPLTAMRGIHLANYLVALTAGAVFVVLLIVRLAAEKKPAGGVMKSLYVTTAIFSAVYLILTVSSRRFDNLSIPLLILASALLAEWLWRDRALRSCVIVALLTVVPPAAQMAAWWPSHSHDQIMKVFVPYFAATRAMRDHGLRGRVLAPWPFGHLIDVAGGLPVVVDNFGTMPDATTFELAHDAMLQTHEDQLAAYCRRNGVRFLFVQHPLRSLTDSANALGIPMSLYVRNGRPTRLTQRLVWWRAFFTTVPLSAHFRLVYVSPQVRVWELTK